MFAFRRRSYEKRLKKLEEKLAKLQDSLTRRPTEGEIEALYEAAVKDYENDLGLWNMTLSTGVPGSTPEPPDHSEYFYWKHLPGNIARVETEIQKLRTRLQV